jgi:hypothetical protein
MGGVSVWHWLVVILLMVPYVWGIVCILRRIGFSRWWVLLALVPYLNLIGLLTLAYAKWPVEDWRFSLRQGFTSGAGPRRSRKRQYGAAPVSGSPSQVFGERGQNR